MLRTKSWVLIGGGLLLLAGVGVLLGWSARAVTLQLAPERTSTSQGGEVATPTATLDATLEVPEVTLLPSPTLPALENQIIVQPGETLYQICRRFCPHNWAAGTLPEDLQQYARQIAEHNRLSWDAVTGGPLIKPGDILQMLPCPPR